MISKTVLFHCQYAQLDSVIYQALIGHFFHWYGRFAAEGLFLKPVKTSEDDKQ